MTADEVKEIVRLINRKDIWDCVIVIIPIIVSIISIIISVMTASRQNKIALFEKRYKAVDTLFFLLEVAGYIIKEKYDKKDLFKVCANNYMAVKQSGEYKIDETNVSSFYARLIFEAGKICSLYKGKKTENVQEFLVALMDCISGICAEQKPDEKLLQERMTKLDYSGFKKEIDKSLQIG